jgi:hypothetical protein
MKRQNYLANLLGSCLIFISLILLVACQAAQPSQAAPAEASVLAANFDYERAAEINAARWQAMADFYQGYDGLNYDSEQAAETNAARWEAMGHFYEEQARLNLDYERASETNAARWQAMADFYEKAEPISR